MECLDIGIEVKHAQNYVDAQTNDVTIVPRHIDIVDEAGGKMYSLNWGLMVGSLDTTNSTLNYEIDSLRIDAAYKKDGNTYKEVELNSYEEEEAVFHRVKKREVEIVVSFGSPFGEDRILLPEDVVSSKMELVTVTPVKYKIASPDYELHYAEEREADREER